MKADDFQRLCLRTEAPITESVIWRFEEVAGSVFSLLSEMSELSTQANELKRYVFYGKGSVGEDCEVAPDVVLRMEDDLRAVHGLLGLASEIGEMIDVHRAYYDGTVPAVDFVNVLEECGDMGWYASVLADTSGSNLADAYEAVIDKLSERYPEKFTEQAALERNLEIERRALESRIDGENLF